MLSNSAQKKDGLNTIKGMKPCTKQYSRHKLKILIGSGGSFITLGSYTYDDSSKSDSFKNNSEALLLSIFGPEAIPSFNSLRLFDLRSLKRCF